MIIIYYLLNRSKLQEQNFEEAVQSQGFNDPDFSFQIGEPYPLLAGHPWLCIPRRIAHILGSHISAHIPFWAN